LHTTQQCKLNGVDPQEIDLLSLIDSSLNYYENLNALNVQLQQLGATSSLNPEAGTEKLREKYQRLVARCGKQKKRIERLKRRNERLKAKLNKLKKPKRKRRLQK
jgi:cell division protein FtsB